MTDPDIAVRDERTVVGLIPMTEEGRAWIDDNLIYESWQWFGGALCVEPRAAEDIIFIMEDQGLVVGRS